MADGALWQWEGGVALSGFGPHDSREWDDIDGMRMLYLTVVESIMNVSCETVVTLGFSLS